jgi:DNA-binding GntR family transcriptional regulator
MSDESSLDRDGNVAFLNRSGPLFDQVYTVLWSRLLDGSIPPGTRLSDVEWAANLNISRTPVREAMRKLQQDGVLVALERGGYEVCRTDTEGLQSLYRCRAVLESLAVREALPKLSKKQFDKLSKLIDQTEKALGRKAFDDALKFNSEFHATIVRSSPNVYLINLLKGLERMILFARSSLKVAALDPVLTEHYLDHLRHTQQDHRRILNLLKARDVDAAAAEMQRHLFETGGHMSEMSQMSARANN